MVTIQSWELSFKQQYLKGVDASISFTKELLQQHRKQWVTEGKYHRIGKMADKITATDLTTIYTMYRAGVSQRLIAQEVGVSESLIWHIVNGKMKYKRTADMRGKQLPQ